jgi:hypothetical protein
MPLAGCLVAELLALCNCLQMYGDLSLALLVSLQMHIGC